MDFFFFFGFFFASDSTAVLSFRGVTVDCLVVDYFLGFRRITIGGSTNALGVESLVCWLRVERWGIVDARSVDLHRGSVTLSE